METKNLQTTQFYSLFTHTGRLLSNNRKYLSILCNKGTQGNYDQINNWINDLETNLKSLTRLLKLFSDGVSIGYAIIGTALCSKDYNVVKKCCELLNF